MEAETGHVELKLSRDEALVLFEWVARFNDDDHEFEDQAEERVLWSIEAMLEKRLVEVLLPDYDQRLASARAQVRDATD